MTVVIIDRNNNRLNESFGVNSIFEIPFFSECYGKRFLNNFSVLKPKEITIFSENQNLNFSTEDASIIFEVTEFEEFLNSSNDDAYFICFSDVYFELKEELLKNISEFSSICYCYERKNVCAILSKKQLPLFFDKHFVSSPVVDDFFIKKAEYNGYCKFMENALDFRQLLRDVFDGKTSVILPRMAQGIYAENEIPKGDFVLIPPVYIADRVQIESGCVIGPYTVVSNDCLIAKNSNITKSVILNNNYISSGCFVDGAVCCPNVVIRRNAAVFSDSVLCNNCTVGEECIIDNGSYLKPFSQIDELKKKYVNFKYETADSPAGFYGYLPEKAALLGAAIGNAFDSREIAVAGDGEPNSTALKLSVLGGAMTTGVQCYDFGNAFFSSMFYFMSYCRLDYAVFISGNKNGTSISVFSKNNETLSNGEYYTIKNIMTAGDIKRCRAEECRPVRQIHGMQRMYIQNLINGFSEKLDFLPIFKSENKYIESVGELAVSKIIGDYSSGKKRILFSVNREGTSVLAECDGVSYNHKKLKELCSFFTNEHKFYNVNTDSLWEFDALILSFKVIEILYQNKLSLSEAVAILPDFYVSQTEIPEKVAIGKLASKLSGRGELLFRNGQLSFASGDSDVKINKSKDGHLKLTVNSASLEIADEIAGELLRLIKQ